MKTFGNVAYVFGIVVAIGIGLLSNNTKPIDNYGGVPCTIKVNKNGGNCVKKDYVQGVCTGTYWTTNTDPYNVFLRNAKAQGTGVANTDHCDAATTPCKVYWAQHLDYAPDGCDSITAG